MSRALAVPAPGPLTGPERAALLRLARAAIAEPLGRRGAVAEARAALPLSPRIERPCGLFVTLRAVPTGDGPAPLRGCIGNMEASLPLWRQVAAVAPRAAFSDPRFPPVRREELDRLRVALSVLGPSEPVDADAIVPGQDGVELEQGDRRAVFLPQVATEQGWDRVRLLEQLSLKAGLPAGAWCAARLRRFRCEGFAESG